MTDHPTPPFKRGNICYDAGGYQLRYVALTHDQKHVVEPLVHCGTDDVEGCYWDEPTIVDEVFNESGGARS